MAGFFKKVSKDAVIDDNTNKLPNLNDNGVIDNPIYPGDYILHSETSKGMVRESNQDSVYTGRFKYCTMGNIFNVCLGMVADGMGGLAKGEIASSIAVGSASSFITSRLYDHFTGGNGVHIDEEIVFNILTEAIQNANSSIYDKGISLNEKIGTTITAAIVIGNTAYFGHVGDSRAYIVDMENKSIEKVTRDHSLVGRLVEMGQINEQEAKSHPRRNEIYKMLGLKEQIEVDTYTRIINGECTILIMSDGLWELVDDSDLLDEVIKCSDVLTASKNLVEKANKNGGYDNISLVIIKPVWKE